MDERKMQSCTFSNGCIASPLYFDFWYTSGTSAIETHDQKLHGSDGKIQNVKFFLPYTFSAL